MNAFFLAINRQGQQFDQDIAENMLQELAPFGRDAHQLVVKDNFALGSQQHWLLPEEVGESQPLIKGERYFFAFNGRVDNRSHLIKKLKAHRRTKLESLSDASLSFEFLLEFGFDDLNSIVGSFAFVLFDSQTQQCTIARDPMGGRHLSFIADQEKVLIATYEMAIAAHPDAPYAINKLKSAEFLSGAFALPEASFLQGAQVLQPGYARTFGLQETKQWRFYKNKSGYRTLHNSPTEYAKEFKRLLTQAVDRRLRCVGNVASTMSGGLDSVPISIIANELARDRQKGFKAYSWVFDNYPEADERLYSQAACELHGVDQRLIKCDDVWPQFNEDMAIDPLNPFGTPYSEFQQETFRQAANDGIQVLVTGMDGDLLFSEAHDIIYELIGAGRFLEAITSFNTYAGLMGARYSALKRYFYQSTKLAHRISAFRKSKRSVADNYLTRELAANLKQSIPRELFQESLHARRPQQWLTVMGNFAGSDYAMGRLMEAKYGVERRNPMRDRDLCEFMLSIPSECLHSGTTTRPIVRQAFAKELPESIIMRMDKTSFSAMVHSRIKQDDNANRWFNEPPQPIFDFVRECYFDEMDTDNVEGALVWWKSAYYHYWHRNSFEPAKVRLG